VGISGSILPANLHGPLPARFVPAPHSASPLLAGLLAATLALVLPPHRPLAPSNVYCTDRTSHTSHAASPSAAVMTGRVVSSLRRFMPRLLSISVIRPDFPLSPVSSWLARTKALPPSVTDIPWVDAILSPQSTTCAIAARVWRVSTSGREMFVHVPCARTSRVWRG